MPFARNPLFVGRKENLQELAQIIKGGSTAAIGQIAAATGLGGIGKTQLAVEFAQRYGQFFAGGVFWLSFASAEGVPTEVAHCGGAGGLNLRADYVTLKIDEQVGLVLAAWQSPLPRLLIFDNCEDEGLLMRWRPPSGGCCVLVTSRRDRWDATLGVQLLSLGVLQRGESIALLRKFRPDLAANDASLDAIASELGDLPLALHLAGSYLQRYQYSEGGQPQTYLAALRRPNLLEHASLQGLKASLSPTGHEQHVAHSFALSYERLKPDEPIDVLAVQALQHAACFAPGEVIPRGLLKKTLNAEDIQAEDALLRLSELGLLEVGTLAQGDVNLHRLLVAFVRSIGIGLDVMDKVEQVASEEAYRINNAGLPAPLTAWQAHLRWLADAAEQRLSKAAGPLSNRLGYHLNMIGDYAGARVVSERALRIDEATLGPDHPNVALDANNLGNVLRALGDYAGARAAFERALQIDEAASGPDHPNVARDVNNLGRVLQALSDYAGARTAFERALRIDEASCGPDRRTVGRDADNLGSVLRDLGDYTGARAACERAIRIHEAAYGPDHPVVARDLNNLGLVLRDLGNYVDARAALERALRIDEASYSPDHPTVARDLNNLGLVLRDVGDHAGALAALELALRIVKNTYSPDHPYLAIDINNLGLVLQDLGDYAGARAACERALFIFEKTLGPEHPNTHRVRENLEGLKKLGSVNSS